MFLATTNRAKQLLYLSYIGHVAATDLRRGYEELPALLTELSAGFRILADLSRLDSMDTECVVEIGKTMELLEPYGVSLVVRVIPNPGKDIGFNIISAFHYKNRPRSATCGTVPEAAKILSL